MPTLNLGVVAHVDAGKTSLTEQLLHRTGVIDRLGRVDDGTTQTDALALERARGITIRAAVASFRLGADVVNLIDTPGHPDFIAEVERSLAVLDGAVLVVSAAAGVQAQTRVLFRALRRLDIPTLVFVNKIDLARRPSAEIVQQVRGRLAAPVVVLQRVRRAGTPAAGVEPVEATEWLDVLTDLDDDLLGDYVADPGSVSDQRLTGVLRRLARTGAVTPLLFGSAITGAGIAELLVALRTLLPRAPESSDVLSGTVFKVERDGPTSTGYVRLFGGRLRIRQRLPGVGGRRGGKITALELYDGGPPRPAEALTAGQIGRVRGPADLQVGDPIGRPVAGPRWSFEHPSLETVITADPATDTARLWAALSVLAAQDPLIAVRRQDDRLLVSLFGEVQQEVLAATLAAEHGLNVHFAPTTVVCVERPCAPGSAAEALDDPANPFLAGIGLRVEPGAPGSGLRYRVAGDRLGTLPVAFFRAVEEAVPKALRHGPHGWQVVDCAVTLTATGYAPRQSHAHATFDKSMSSTGRDFRHLTPLVLAGALSAAGTVVCEPIHRVRLEVPDDALAAVLAALAVLGGTPEAPHRHGDLAELEARLSVRALPALTRRLPGLTRGEGVLEAVFDHHAPVRDHPVPRGRPADPDPYHRRDYLLARAGVRSAVRD